MSRVFQPIVYCKVPTSPMHDVSGKYFVAIGIENWGDDDKNLVIKVQMEYNGKRHGRKAPSYPITQSNIYSADWDNVCKAVERVRQAYKDGLRDCEIPFEEN